MTPRKTKNFSGDGNPTIDISDFRQPPWKQTWDSVTYDFRRWIYVGRPRLENEGAENGLLHAGRDHLVEAIRDAVWNKNVRQTTKRAYCSGGLPYFFQFLDHRLQTGKPITQIHEIDQPLLKDYIAWLKCTKDANTPTGNLGYIGAKSAYALSKAVLQHLVGQNVLPFGIFPANPFPNAQRAVKNHKPYPIQIMERLLQALGQDIRNLRNETLKIPSSQALTIYLLVMAARTGRNTESLLTLTRDSLQPHPIKPAQLAQLITYKNRGYCTSIQGFEYRDEIQVRSVPLDVISLFRQVDALTAPLASEVPPELRQKLWLFRSAGSKNYSQVLALGRMHIDDHIEKIVERHGLEEDGRPLQLNISRLRATFSQNMWVRTGGDIIKTAYLNGNSPQVTDRHYLAVTPEMEANHRRLGILMHADLSGALDDQIKLEEVSSETGIPVEQIIPLLRGDNNTGVGRCRDPRCGAKAPSDGSLCIRWLGCFTCPDQVVLESDLYRLFSLYWLLIKERNLINRVRWEETWGQVVRIIEEEIVKPNLRTPENPKGYFDPYQVKKAKEKAWATPHISWRNRAILGESHAED